MFTFEELVAAGEALAEAKRAHGRAVLEERHLEADEIALAVASGMSATAAATAVSKGGSGALRGFRVETVDREAEVIRAATRFRAMVAVQGGDSAPRGRIDRPLSDELVREITVALPEGLTGDQVRAVVDEVQRSVDRLGGRGY